MHLPAAYFLTWTCYGTWLHGNQRGSVDDDNNRVGHAPIAPDAFRESARSNQLKHEPVILTSEARGAVDDAIRKTASHRKWTVHTLNVRSNHVHVVITTHEPHPEPCMQTLKSWATRTLRARGHEGPVWTRHGSTRYLWNADEVARAVRYVRDGQDGKAGPRAYARGSDKKGRP
ncbi:MAG: transposase [Phycisphaerales bacterium JB040]